MVGKYILFFLNFRKFHRSAPYASNQFSHSVVSDSLQPMDWSMPGLLVHHQLLESTQTHVHPTISSSVVPFSSCPQSFPASGSFQMSQLFASGGQSIGVSASASVLPMNTQDWSALGWTSWISLQSKRLSRVKSSSALSFLYSPTITSIHDYGKNHSFN